MSNPELHVKIDKLICQGTGYCVRLEPEIFVIGADDLGEVLVEKPDAKYFFMVSIKDLKPGDELCANYNLYTYPKTGVGIQML